VQIRKARAAEVTKASHAVAGADTSYAWMKRRLVLLIVLGAVLPLLGLGWTLHLHHTRRAHTRLLASFETQLDRHQKTIELFLADRKARLQLLADSHDQKRIGEPGRIAELLAALNRSGWSFADLGALDATGRHLAYAGPFDLLERNYADAKWFREVMRRGVYVSDMFRGYRDEPHFIIAISRPEGDRTWILRATIDTESFRALVENVRMGRSGEVFLLDRQARYQTRPRFGGEIMGPSGLAPLADRIGPRVAIEPAQRDENGFRTPRRVVGRVWLDEPSWLLVIRQDYDEAFADLVHADRAVLVYMHAAVLIFGAAGLLVTQRMLAMLRQRDRLGADLQRQLRCAGKMAALGELAAGIAHEINNPLAIIATERQLLVDDLERGDAPPDRGGLRGALDQIATQVARCRRITHALLDFARPAEVAVAPLDLNAFLREAVTLVEREAHASGIVFELELAAALPTVHADPSLMQQVLLNLVNNAIDAHGGKPYGTVTVTTHARPERRCVEILITDTGCGVAPEDAERIFEPFFTTKRAGEGTGLGLSICLGIVQGLGGDISLESESGRGTTVHLLLPVHSPAPTETEVSS